MNTQSNRARTCQNPGPWHPEPDLARMPGATDLSAIPTARSVLVFLPTYLHRLTKWYK